MRQKTKQNHMHAFYATRIVAFSPEHLESSLALSKSISFRFCLAVTYICCDWLIVIISIAFYIIQKYKNIYALQINTIRCNKVATVVSVKKNNMAFCQAKISKRKQSKISTILLLFCCIHANLFSPDEVLWYIFFTRNS